MTNRQPTSTAGWWRLLLAALAAAVAVLLGAGTASATTVPNVDTRVGASTPATVVVVGPHECITAGQRWGHAPPGAVSVVATGVAAKSVDEIPAVIYRGGGKSPSNFRLREGEGALSFRDSLSDPLPPAKPVFQKPEWVGVDTSKLPPGSVVPDGIPGSAVTPPGHVSVYVDDPMLLKEAIVESGRFPK